MEKPVSPVVAPLSAQKQDEFNGTEGDYLLPHHKTEIDRLKRQHFFMKAATDDKLTPVDLPIGAMVLDSGCADGKP